MSIEESEYEVLRRRTIAPFTRAFKTLLKKLPPGSEFRHLTDPASRESKWQELSERLETAQSELGFSSKTPIQVLATEKLRASFAAALGVRHENLYSSAKQAAICLQIAAEYPWPAKLIWLDYLHIILSYVLIGGVLNSTPSGKQQFDSNDALKFIEPLRSLRLETLAGFENTHWNGALAGECVNRLLDDSDAEQATIILYFCLKWLCEAEILTNVAADNDLERLTTLHATCFQPYFRLPLSMDSKIFTSMYASTSPYLSTGCIGQFFRDVVIDDTKTVAARLTESRSDAPFFLAAVLTESRAEFNARMGNIVRLVHALEEWCFPQKRFGYARHN